MVCGCIGLCAILAIAFTALGIAMLEFQFDKPGLLGWFVQNQVMNLFVVAVSARSFLAPTKPKFQCNNLEQIMFKRPSFFQTNGGFAVVLSDALIQTKRDQRLRKSLLKVLGEGMKWREVIHLCMDGASTDSDAESLILGCCFRQHGKR